MKLLALEPKSYYDELGISDILQDNFDITFGLVFFPYSRIRILRYDAVLACIYHDSYSYRACLYAGSLGVPVIFFMDGILDWNNLFDNRILKKTGIKPFFPPIHDAAYVTNKYDKKFLESLGLKCNLYIPKRVFDRDAGFGEISRNQETRVLLTTANTPYFNDQEKEDLFNLLESLVGVLDERQLAWDYRVFDPEILDHVRNISPKSSNIIEPVIEELAANYSIVITTPSSLAIPFIVNGTPVVFLDYRPSPLFLQSGWRISNSSQIDWVLDDILSGNIRERLAFQSSQICLESFDVKGMKEMIDSCRPTSTVTRNLNSWRILNFHFLMRAIYKNFFLKYYLLRRIAKKIRKMVGR